MLPVTVPTSPHRKRRYITVQPTQPAQVARPRQHHFGHKTPTAPTLALAALILVRVPWLHSLQLSRPVYVEVPFIRSNTHDPPRLALNTLIAAMALQRPRLPPRAMRAVPELLVPLDRTPRHPRLGLIQLIHQHPPRHFPLRFHLLRPTPRSLGSLSNSAHPSPPSRLHGGHLLPRFEASSERLGVLAEPGLDLRGDGQGRCGCGSRAWRGTGDAG